MLGFQQVEMALVRGEWKEEQKTAMVLACGCQSEASVFN